MSKIIMLAVIALFVFGCGAKKEAPAIVSKDTTVALVKTDTAKVEIKKVDTVKVITVKAKKK